VPALSVKFFFAGPGFPLEQHGVLVRCGYGNINFGGPIPMGRSEEYRRFAAECLEMASAFDNPQARAVLLQMAQVWFRLAGEATEGGGTPEAETCVD
jgi:hypothetical protein